MIFLCGTGSVRVAKVSALPRSANKIRSYDANHVVKEILELKAMVTTVCKGDPKLSNQSGKPWRSGDKC